MGFHPHNFDLLNPYIQNLLTLSPAQPLTELNDFARHLAQALGLHGAFAQQPVGLVLGN